MEFTTEDKIHVAVGSRESKYSAEYSVRYNRVRFVKAFKNGSSIVKVHEYRQNNKGEPILYDLGCDIKVDSDALFDTLEDAKVGAKKMLVKIMEGK